jgi:hypothetical protein
MADEQELAELRHRLADLEQRFDALATAVGLAGLREIGLLEHLGLPTRQVKTDTEGVMDALNSQRPPYVVRK